MERFKAAAYCRLSHEDINRQSESIDNQRLIIESYIKSHSDEFELAGTYIDDGISGMTYDRAAYADMMEAVSRGCVNAIIVKDLSRIGREQVETLNLIRKEFIVRNIRFIAITDDYDSFNSSKSDGLSTSVKLLLNDYYCADISKKVRSAQQAKRKKGCFIGSYAPYGYIKSPDNKNRLIVDETAARVVRKIFSLYIGGMGKVSIARLLNKESIPNPTIYKQTVQGLKYKNSNKLSSTSYWTYSTIHKILTNEVYIGNTVQHKSEIKAYNIRKKVPVPKEDWCIAENTHEAIIDKDVFETAHSMLSVKRRKPEFTDNLSKYTGLFFCKECGRAMHKYISKPKKDGTRYITFKCGTYSKLGKNMCTIHSIKESDLDELVLSEIRRNVKVALSAESCSYIKSKCLTEIKTGQQKRLEELKSKLSELGKRRITMLKHLSDGIISTEDFKLFDAENKKETELIKESIYHIEEKLADKNRQLKSYNNWLTNILRYKDIKEVDREILTNLIEKIYISETPEWKTIEIIFKFKNPLEE